MTFLSFNKILAVVSTATCAFMLLTSSFAEAGCCYNYPRQMRSGQSKHYQVVENQENYHQPNYTFGQFQEPTHFNQFETVEKVTPSIPPQYINQHAWLSSVPDQVTYGPITISHVQLNKGNQIVMVKPGEDVRGILNYRVDAADQELFHRYHLVIGLQDIGAQDCVTHTYGVWNSTGRGDFTLKAPVKPGVYAIRFSFQEAQSCEAGRGAWNNENVSPSASATIGAIIVE